MRRRAAAAMILAATGLVFPALAFALDDVQFELKDSGEPVVDYSAFGHFEKPGTTEYAYVVTDSDGLARALGDGIYPSRSLDRDPGLADFKKSHPNADAWMYAESGDPREAMYAWYLSKKVDDGTRAFYVAEALRRGGHFRQAVKAYHALIVHFPKTVIWSRDGKYHWYAALEAMSRARKLCAEHPQMGIQLEGAFLRIAPSSDGNLKNDRVSVWPGKIVPARLEPVDVSTLSIVEERGGRVKAVKYSNGHWGILKDGLPFFVKGITYTSTRIGESPHAHDLTPWMKSDVNGNGLNDGMFDAWLDANQNDRIDPGEETIGDAQLLKELGVNAIRYYHGQDASGNYDPSEYDKDLMRTLARDYGLTFIMGDFAGAYTIGSGASWEGGTDYRDAEQKKRMLGVIKDMVLDHKDEPYVLMWLLGNENQHPFTHTNAAAYPKEYAKFLEEAARLIKSLDPQHPVASCNLNFSGLPAQALYSPSIDIYGANGYSGAFSMGSTVQQAKMYFDRPLLFTEWGSDAYAEGRGPDEDAQADYIRGNWADIVLNAAGAAGEGNVIGGVLFEWMDEWWKTTKGDGWGDPAKQNIEADFSLPFADGWAHEEWYGLMSQGSGRNSPFLRQPRKAYYILKELWNA